MANPQPKQKLTYDELIHENMDQANKQEYYNIIMEELREEELKEEFKLKDPALKQALVKDELEKYQQSYRNFYYTTEILSNNKSNEFFEDIVRQLHPSVKIKGPIKNLLKTVTKVFTQQLAETCLEVMNLSDKAEVDVDVVNDANRLIQKRKTKTNKISNMFNYMH